MRETKDVMAHLVKYPCLDRVSALEGQVQSSPFGGGVREVKLFDSITDEIGRA